MVSPTYSQAPIHPNMMGVFWAEENTAAGTPPILSSVSWNFEPELILAPSPQRSIYTRTGGLRLPVANMGTLELNHHGEFTVSGPYRAGGVFERTLIRLLGDHDNAGTAETTTGSADPYTHVVTPGIKGVRVPTMSFINDSGTSTSNDGMLYVYAVPYQWVLTAQADSVLNVTASYCSYWGTVSAAPSAATTDAGLETLSYQGTYHVKQAGSASDYAAEILGCTLTIGRGTPEILNSVSRNIKNPRDLPSGPISMTAGLTVLYDNMQAGSIIADFIADGLVGDVVAHKNTFNWTDANSHSLTISGWPAKWQPDTNTQPDQNSIKVSGTLAFEQDRATRTALTMIDTVTVVNGVAGALVV